MDAPRPTAAHRRQIIPRVFLPALLAALCLFTAAESAPGSVWFYAATAASAAVLVLAWWWSGTRQILTPNRAAKELLIGLGAGLLLGAVFILGALVIAQIPFLAGPVEGLLAFAGGSALATTVVVTVVNGIAEELFFRGTAAHWLSIPGAILLYIVVTAAMQVPLLAVAAVCVGALAHLLVHRWSLASAVSMHVSWSIVMLFALPQLITG